MIDRANLNIKFVGLESAGDMEEINLGKQELALEIKNLHKSYGSQKILNDLNMKIPKGTIYGLLGPSGCGKTTLLNIIVGLLPLDAGEIRSSVTKQKCIGFMPQDIALFSGFTVMEIMNYYGLLYGLELKDIDERTDELLGFLLITDKHRIADSLSGGQQRRVSFAVSLLHRPDFLVLDEPTVGVDPVLRTNIWNLLLKMTTVEKKSIIISTHYIDEAQQADNIGLMRDGMLLAEGNPRSIMSAYGCNNLEDVFLHLSKRQEQLSIAVEQEVKKKSKRPRKRAAHHLEESEIFTLHRLKAQVLKQLYFVRRNVLTMVFVLFLPIVICTLQTLTIGGDPTGVSIAVVNDELEFGQHCEDIFYKNGCTQNVGHSCWFLDEVMKKNIKIVEVENLDDAKNAVLKAKMRAAMHFPANFSTNLLTRLSKGRFADNEAIEMGEVALWVDSTDYLIKELLRKKLIESYINFLREFYQNCTWSTKLAEIPINFKTPIFGSMDLNFTYVSIPPLVITVSFFLPLVYTLSSILSERLYGIWERTLLAGTSLLEILLAHTLIQTILFILQTIFVIYLEYYVYLNPLVGSLALVIFLVILNGYGGMFMGSLIAFTSNSFTEASMLSLGVYFMTVIIGGTIWPVEGMHKILYTVFVILPIGLPSEALRAITNKGWTLSHPVVFNGFVSSVAYLFIFMVGTVVVVKLQRLGYKTNVSFM